MSTAVLLGALPGVTCLLVAYLCHPAAPAFAPVRLALARSMILLGAAGAVAVEALSAVHALTAGALITGWSLALAAAAALAARRYLRRSSVRDIPRRSAAALRDAWARADRGERTLALALGGLLLAELLLALASPPNNYDSQTYHLPRIEHWVVQRDVSFYPSSIVRQLAMAPGAEYLLLHLRLLTGGDALYNSLQWCAGLGCVLLASRVAGQLGGSPRAQLIAGFVVGTTPIVALEATSTQTDLAVAAWVAAVATLVLDELTRGTPVANLAFLGAATGMTALTKANGLLAAGPLLVVWLVAQLRRGAGRALAGGLLVAALAAVIAGPFFVRVDRVYGSPLGPEYLRDSIGMQRHDPPSVLVNALRIGQNALQTPITPINGAAASGIERLSRAMGVDPSDRAITYWGTTFPSESWQPDEDRAAFPVQAVLVLLGAAFLVVRPGRRVPGERAGAARLYAVAFWVTLLGYVATVKWQPWGNRLILFVLVFGAPLAGLWLEAALRRRSAPVPAPASAPSRGLRVARLLWSGEGLRRRVAFAGAVACLVGAGCAGWLAVGYGWPRRLVGHGSVFADSTLGARFQRRPEWEAPYVAAAEAVRASGARRVGLVQGYDTWEYPWWVLLPGDDIISLRSLEPGVTPPAPSTMDAVVCVSTLEMCQRYAPAGWTVEMNDGIGYAVPARRPGRGPAGP